MPEVIEGVLGGRRAALAGKVIGRAFITLPAARRARAAVINAGHRVARRCVAYRLF
jgi:hypothetical protein